MAVAPLTPSEQSELNRLLEENAQISDRIRIINEKIALAVCSEREELEDMMEQEKIRLRLQKESAKEYEKRKQYLDYEESALESLASMSHGALKTLKAQTAGGNLLSSITARTIAMKEAEISMDEDARKASEKERTALESVTSSMIAKSEELAKIKSHHAEEDSNILEFEKSIANLQGEAREEAELALKTYKNMTKQLERHEELHKQQHELMHHLPGFITDAMDYAKGLVSALGKLGPLALVFAAAGAALHSFIALDQAAEAI
jgi:chromosome segregation ATPase